MKNKNFTLLAAFTVATVSFITAGYIVVHTTTLPIVITSYVDTIRMPLGDTIRVSNYYCDERHHRPPKDSMEIIYPTWPAEKLSDTNWIKRWDSLFNQIDKEHQ
jgi:hypothetical protein